MYGRYDKHAGLKAFSTVTIMLAILALVITGIVYAADANTKYGTTQECTPYSESLGLCMP